MNMAHQKLLAEMLKQTGLALYQAQEHGERTCFASYICRKRKKRPLVKLRGMSANGQELKQDDLWRFEK